MGDLDFDPGAAPIVREFSRVAGIALLGLALALLTGEAQAKTLGTASAPQVRTAAGVLRGTTSGEVTSFKGVPFAADPVGAMRWRPPGPVKPWAGVRDAQAFGAPCAQPDFGWNRPNGPESREACLYLNIWIPRHAGRGRLPVMVFLHGGANHGGSARGADAIDPSYDGARLARRGVIVVTANYRLGVFGFLAHPELTAESPHHASGNYGLMDQVAALEWVKANIERFGGDPGNVTAFGQSAGSLDIGALMTSPLADGLFAKAILQSYALVGRTAALPTLAAEEANGVELARQMGASGPGAIAALRGRPAAEIAGYFASGGPLPYKDPRIIFDGYVLPQQPALVWKAGREAKVPILIGATARDGDSDSMGVSGTPKADATLADKARPLVGGHIVQPIGQADLAAIRAYFGAQAALADDAARRYADPAGAGPDDGDVMTAFHTDALRCGAALQARWHVRLAPSWLYHFSHGYEPLGAVHLWDMQYVFGVLSPIANQPRDRRLVDQVQAYWAAFARTGVPSAPGAPKWPTIDPDAAYLDFTSQGAVAKTGLRREACELVARKVDLELEQMGGARP